MKSLSLGLRMIFASAVLALLVAGVFAVLINAVSGLNDATRREAHAKDVTWLHPSGREMSEADWNDSNLRAVAVLLNGASTRATLSSDLLIVFNADEAPVDIRIPALSGAKWTVVFDTSLDAPASTSHSPVQDAPVHVGERSVMLLETVATRVDEP